jgi:WXG100 family type VII secretion target
VSAELGVSVLRVDFAVLAGLSGSIERSIRETEESLATLSTHVTRVAEIWTGAASEGFQRAVDDWMAGQRDLRVRLQDLHDLVVAAHDNHAQAVRANVAMWRM